MLGPLVFINILSLGFKQKVIWPIYIRNSGLIVLGYIMGSSFTNDTLSQILSQLPAMFFSTISTMLFCLVLAYIIHRKTGISRASSILGSTPGGMTQMTVLSEEIADSNLTVVTFLQTIRLLSVVFIVPFLAVHGLSADPGQASVATSLISTNSSSSSISDVYTFAAASIISALAASRLKLPTPYLLGPIIAGATLVVNGFHPPQLPRPIIITAQLFVGAYLGVTTKPTNLSNWKQLLPYSLASGVAIVIFSLVIGYILSYWHNIDLITAFLSTAPGGMTEMGITAMSVHADISIITAYQLFRLLFILFIVPPIFKWWLGSLE